MHKKLEILSNNDPILGKLISKIGPLEIRKSDDHYQSLVKSIIGQQLSVKAAGTIFNRFLILNNGIIKPENTLNIPNEELRSIGISYQKINYIKDLSQKVLEEELVLSGLENLNNDDVINSLTNVKGIGKWTAEMFLIFSLGRENVLSVLDIGLQRGAKWLYNGDDGKEILINKKDSWDPYQSVASLYLWEIVNRGWVVSYKSFNDYREMNF